MPTLSRIEVLKLWRDTQTSLPLRVVMLRWCTARSEREELCYLDRILSMSLLLLFVLQEAYIKQILGY